jgi:hypothetical protein
MMTAKFNSKFRAVALTAALALALPVFGQATQTRVNIPLDFEMGQHSMAAGQYVFERHPTGWQMFITDPAGVKRAIMTIPVGSTRTPFTGKLVFEKLGATYRLAEVHLTGSPNGVQIPRTKAQVELAKRQKPTRLDVAMVRK